MFEVKFWDNLMFRFFFFSVMNTHCTFQIYVLCPLTLYRGQSLSFFSDICRLYRATCLACWRCFSSLVCRRNTQKMCITFYCFTEGLGSVRDSWTVMKTLEYYSGYNDMQHATVAQTRSSSVRCLSLCSSLCRRSFSWAFSSASCWSLV